MASKALQHGRSLSLPSASPPAISQFDDNLSRLRSSEGTSSSLSSMNERVNGLKNLYESIDDLLQLNGLKGQENLVEQILDDYVQLLDSCSTVKDLISFAKQDARDLLSAVRRKDTNGVQGYLASRRKSKKMIQKSLKYLRTSKSKDNEETGVVCMLKEAGAVTFSLFESLLAYTIGTNRQERKSGWTLVSKMIRSKKETNFSNEFNKTDSLLQTNQEEKLVGHLKEMDLSIQIVEEELEFLFRKLIKTRVFLLNILNN